MKEIAKSVLPVLSHTLNIESLTVVENLLCEALRWYAGEGTDRLLKYDVVLRGGRLFQLKGGRLYAGWGGSRMEEIEFPKYGNNDSGHYSPLVKWWALNLQNPEEELGDGEDLT